MPGEDLADKRAGEAGVAVEVVAEAVGCRSLGEEAAEGVAGAKVAHCWRSECLLWLA